MLDLPHAGSLRHRVQLYRLEDRPDGRASRARSLIPGPVLSARLVWRQGGIWLEGRQIDRAPAIEATFRNAEGLPRLDAADQAFWWIARRRWLRPRSARPLDPHGRFIAVVCEDERRDPPPPLAPAAPTPELGGGDGD